MTETKQTPMPNLWFRLMALEYRTRKKPRSAVDDLGSAGVAKGMRVLDFGCGPGRFTLPAAEMVGEGGRVYAVDVHPMAIRMVEKAARTQGLANVQTIQSSCATGLDAETIDVALLFDALHDVVDKESVLGEIRRVLKRKGALLYRDHTLGGMRLVELMRANDFRLASEGSILSFVKC